jgi:hypothetical protein
MPSRGPVCFQFRQIDTWLWPARSPALFSPEATRTVRSNVSAVRSAIDVPVRYLPASTSISACSRSYRALVVTNFSVGTNGKFVIEPLPVVKKIRLQPLATSPATDSRSFPGLSMKT